MFVVYFYDPFGNSLTQFFDIFDLKIRKKLNDVSTASFSIELKHNLSYEILKEFNKVKIFKEDGEKLMFSWVIKQVSADFDKYNIVIFSDEYLLKRKLLNSAKSYTNTAISDILADIFVWYNIQTDASKIISIDFDKNTKFFDILKKLSEFGYDFKIEDNTIIFKQLIWVDRTFGDNFLQLYANEKETNIAKYKTLYDADNLVNKAIVWDNVYEDTVSQNIYWVVEEYFTEWDESILEERKYSVREIEAIPIVQDWFAFDVWDLISVDVNLWNEILDFSGNLKIVEKSYEFKDLEKTEIKLSKWKAKTPTLLEKIKQLNDDVYNLKIKL